MPLSTSDVPGTEGRETALRFDKHGNKLKFGASRFFVIPNFADTGRFLVVQFQGGPGKRGHLDIRGANVVRSSGMTGVEPSMSPRERLHQIEAADPRAQATFPCC